MGDFERRESGEDSRDDGGDESAESLEKSIFRWLEVTKLGADKTE